MTSHKGETRHPSAKGERASEMSMLGGLDSSDTTAKPIDLQGLKGPLSRKVAIGDTSAMAAEANRVVHSADCRKVMDVIRTLGTATPEEIKAHLHEHHCIDKLLTTVRARVCDLRRAGFVIKSDRKGVGESGYCRVIAWRLTTEEERSALLAEASEAHSKALRQLKAKAYRFAAQIIASGGLTTESLGEAIFSRFVLNEGEAPQ